MIRKITLALSLVLVTYAAILAGGVGKPDSWIVDDKGETAFVDYIALWGAGRLALQGRPAAAYDWQAHADAMSEGLGRQAQKFPFPYPPTFLALMAPIAALPYLQSLLVWCLGTLALYLFTLGSIVGRWEGAVWLGAMIVTLANIVAGQNGFLTAALVGGGLLLLPQRPVLAGVLIGLLSYKPHLGLLIPIALAAGGHWRAFASAAATVIVTALAATDMFGIEPWYAFVDNLGRFGAEVAAERFMVTGKLQSAYGFLATLGAPKGVAMAAQAALTLSLVGLTALVWRSATPYPVKAAFLATAAVLVSPYVFIYDLTLLAIAQAFLLRHWLEPRGLGQGAAATQHPPHIPASPSSAALEPANEIGFTRREAIVLLAINTVIVSMMSITLPMGFLGSLLMLAATMNVAWPWIWPHWIRQPLAAH